MSWLTWGSCILSFMLASVSVCLTPLRSFAGTCEMRAFHLTDTAEYPYFSADGMVSPAIAPLIRWAKQHGANEIVINPIGYIFDPSKNEITRALRSKSIELEREGYLRLIKQIQSEGMNVGLRPIVLVVDPINYGPLYVKVGGQFVRIWHGVIEPENPETWYENYFIFHKFYLEIAAYSDVKSYTLGAELGSMTVGNPQGSERFQKGFLDLFLDLIQSSRKIIPPSVLMEYNVNFTDDWVLIHDDQWMSAGELGTWVNTAIDGKTRQQRQIREIWSNLDRIGIDSYKSLITDPKLVPDDLGLLRQSIGIGVQQVKRDLEFLLASLFSKIGFKKPFAIRELGFKSMTNGFVDPFLEAHQGEVNLSHQSLAYDAYLNVFCDSKSTSNIFGQGLTFWDLSTNPFLHGPGDSGFSPVGKIPSEEVLQSHWLMGL